MAAWLMTETAQLVVTLIVLIGGGFLIGTGHAPADYVAQIQTMQIAVVSFWLGIKAAQQIAPPTPPPSPPAPTTPPIVRTPPDA